MRTATYDEHALGFSWTVEEAMQRTSHALVVDGRAWLVDPVVVDEALARLDGVGEVAGVLQLLDRHGRGCAALAARYGVPHLRVPDTVQGTPFEALPVVRVPGWNETALWWPDRAALVVAEVVGDNAFYTGGATRVGIHPLLRARPPRSLRGFAPEHLLLGHGTGVHGSEASAALEEAYARSRRDIPRVLAKLPSFLRG